MPLSGPPSLLFDLPFRAYCVGLGERLELILTLTDHTGATTLYRPALVGRWGALIQDGIVHNGLEWADDAYLPNPTLAATILHALVYEGRPNAGSLAPSPSPLQPHIHYSLARPHADHPAWNPARS